MVDTACPLHDRVTAPESLPLPAHPDVAAWRPATAADIDGIWQLDRAMGAVDHPDYLATRDEIAEDFGFSHFRAELDSLVGLDSAGLIVANGMVMLPPGQQTLVRSVLHGGVHPDLRGRGIGRELLAWQLGRARQQLASSPKTLPGWVIVFTDERAPQNAPLYERAGLSLARHFLALERVLADPIREFAPADGIRIEPYRPELSAAVHSARDEVFMDHWSSQPMSDEAWDAFAGSSQFRPDLSFVALGAGPGGTERVVGFVLSTVNEEDWERQGFRGSYISMVGVARDWRGRHIAQALLAEQLRASRAAGQERATLHVDSAGATGALGLYTGMGFTQTNREFAFTLEF